MPEHTTVRKVEYNQKISQVIQSIRTIHSIGQIISIIYILCINFEA